MKKLVTSHQSDTHNNFSALTGEGNILFHHGDATNGGTKEEVSLFGKYLNKKLNDFDHIVYIPGNHDFLFETSEKEARALVGESDRIHVLINQSISLFDLKIFGSPYSIRYEDWVFMKSGEALFAEWDKIPKDVEILITHSPPYGVLDYQPSAGHLGCNNLMYRIEHEFKKLILHGFGHVHESNGVREKDNKLFLNSAIMGSEYSGPFNSWLLNWEDKKIVNYERLED